MLYFKKNLLLIFLGFITSITAFSQPANDRFKKIPAALVRQDFLVLRDTLQKIHPSLYRYQDKITLDHIFDSCIASVRDSMLVADFYALTSFVIAAIGDGHTNCKLPNDIMDSFMGNAKVFPAMVMFIHNRAFIFCCKQNDALAATELLSINSHSLNEIIRRLFGYIQSDGYIESHKNWEILDKFQVLYDIVYGQTSSYLVTYKTKSGEIKNTTLQADKMENIFCSDPFPRPDKYLGLTYQPGNIAVLSIKTFFNDFLDKTGENFGRFLDSAFYDMKNKKAQKLLIDIRGNQGGNDGNGELLYSYLTNKPFRYYASQETLKENFTERDHPNLALQQPEGNNFKGKVYILADGRSFSASAEFSSIVKTNSRGIFIGEEYGGGYYGNTSGDEANVTLPNTQIEVRIPMVKYSMAVKKLGPGEWGIKPDYPFYPTISDIIENTDGQMKYALAMVAKE
jgi:hypothetical protein